MHINIKDKKECSGCTACFNVCPKSCINMKSDNEGFLYPLVDKKVCIECGKCVKVCPIINNVEDEKGKLPLAAITRSKNNDTLLICSSGGFGYELSKYVIDNNGYVFGVKINENMKVVHSCATTINEIKKFSGSKYVQSYLGDSFKVCKELLIKEELVLFTGTPCQIEGLISYLGKSYDNLLTMDMICHGVPSPVIWDKYVDYIQKKYKSKIKDLNFRNKDYGYRSTCMKIVFENGKKYKASPRVDIMLKGFFKHITNRPACGDCAFKKINHVSDFTVYDCWVAEKYDVGCKNDNKGYTNLFINNQKSNDILDKMKSSVDIHEIEAKRIIPKGGDMILNSAIPHKKRKEFWSDINNTTKPYDKYLTTFVEITTKDKMIENSKAFLSNIGVMSVVSRNKKK